MAVGPTLVVTLEELETWIIIRTNTSMNTSILTTLQRGR